MDGRPAPRAAWCAGGAQFDAASFPVVERMLDGPAPALAELRRRGLWRTLGCRPTFSKPRPTRRCTRGLTSLSMASLPVLLVGRAAASSLHGSLSEAGDGVGARRRGRSARPRRRSVSSCGYSGDARLLRQRMGVNRHPIVPQRRLRRAARGAASFVISGTPEAQRRRRAAVTGDASAHARRSDRRAGSHRRARRRAPAGAVRSCLDHVRGRTPGRPPLLGPCRSCAATSETATANVWRRRSRTSTWRWMPRCTGSWRLCPSTPTSSSSAAGHGSEHHAFRPAARHAPRQCPGPAAPVRRGRRRECHLRVRATVPPRMRAAVGSALPPPVVHELVSRLYLHGVEWGRTRAFVLPGDHSATSG